MLAWKLKLDFACECKKKEKEFFLWDNIDHG